MVEPGIYADDNRPIPIEARDFNGVEIDVIGVFALRE